MLYDDDTSNFQRTQFQERLFDEFDVIVGMGKEHKDYILQEYNKKIWIVNGSDANLILL
jgi:protein-tyrosine phosphatase